MKDWQFGALMTALMVILSYMSDSRLGEWGFIIFALFWALYAVTRGRA